MKHLKQNHFLYLSIFFMLLRVNSFSQAKKDLPAPFILYGKILMDEKPVENVSIELFKKDQLLKKILTTRNGKYSFVMNQDTLNQENEYVIHVTKEGTVPKTLVVNTYIPKEEYDDNKYDYNLEITLLPTKVNDIVLERPSGKIKWNTTENNYGIDQVYAKIIKKEEDKLKRNPDKYLKDLAEKMKKEEEAKRKKIEEEEMKKKAEEVKMELEELARKAKEREAAAIAKMKEQEAAELAIKEKLSAIKTELKEISKTNDSTQHQKSEEGGPLRDKAQERQDVMYDPFDYERKKGRIQLEKSRQHQEKTKNNNLAAKYETKNVMSSLLDAVDEHDKRTKE